jgi:hypothetical protein
LSEQDDPRPLIEQMSKAKAYQIRRTIQADVNKAKREREKELLERERRKAHKKSFVESGGKYTPIICKKCKEEIYQVVDVTVRCPLGWQYLTKTAIRNDCVAIQGVKWEDTQWFCGCETSRPSPSRDRRVGRPGVRWNKGMKPTPHERMKNLYPVQNQPANEEELTEILSKLNETPEDLADLEAELEGDIYVEEE